MFDNIGGKIKTLARVLCWIGIILSILAGGALIATGFFTNETWNQLPMGAAVISGIAVAAGGSLLSWISSFFMYGFGELIEKTSEIANNTKR